jgi:hypothetical protein
MSEPESMGLYMYCIVRCREARQFATLGVGERGDIVCTVSSEDLAAVVSDSPIIEYESSRRNMMAHTLVLEEVMREFAILPIRFGTVASSSEAIQEKVLKRRGREMNALLDEMDGRKELGLKAFWYEEAIFREIVEENPPIRELRDSLAGLPPQQSYYDRIHLGEMVKAALDKKRGADAEMILARLRPLACRYKSNPVVTDRNIVNAAFLVDGSRDSEFDQAVRQLDAEMGHRLMLKYVDQAPPYNFVGIAINWGE